MLLADGWSVLGASRTPPDLHHDAFDWTRVDVGGNLGHLHDWMAEGIDALIHCAGIRGPHAPLEEESAEWAHTINVNLMGTYRIVRTTLPALRQSEDGRILLFSGGGAFNPSPEYSAYAVAKAGVVSLMETLAEELKGTRVTVNAVAPGYVPTSIHSDPVDDGGEAMRTAVACVRHLLSPQTTGLTGKTVSAAHDDWPHINQWNVERLNASPDGTRYRMPIAMLQRSALAV